MRFDLQKSANAYRKAHTRHRRVAYLLAAASLLVVFLVFRQLMQPVITMAADPFCGQMEHTHTESCYTQALSCAQEDSDHVHEDACFVTVLSCTQTEHVHDETCYPSAVAEPTLLPMTAEGFAADEDIQAPTAVPSEESTVEPSDVPQPEPLVEETEEPLLPLPTEEPTAEPTEAPTAVLTAAPEEEPSAEPTEAPTAVPTAVPEEESTAQPTQLPMETLSLSVSSLVRSCFAGDTVPFAIELSGAVSAACTASVDDQEVDVQPLSPDAEGCTVLVPASLASPATLRVTVTATDAAGVERTAQCQIPCAVHRPEDASLWSSFASRTGAWPSDLAAIARSQVGYSESSEDFSLADDGTVQGYTRYGHWAGAPYGEWNTAFAAFCAEYAGVPSSFPTAQSADRWRRKLVEADLYADADTCTPSAGDVAFLHVDGTPRVGIVVGASSTQIDLVEGDVQGTVALRRYAPQSSAIRGYGLLSKLYAQSVAAPVPDLTAAPAATAAPAPVTAKEPAVAPTPAPPQPFASPTQDNGPALAVTKVAPLTPSEAVPAASNAKSPLPENQQEVGQNRAVATASEAAAAPVTPSELSMALFSLPDPDDGSIAVSLVIDNSHYTQDPDSGNTHLTVGSPIVGSDLTFTSWAGRYQVTGSGTLASYTIPSGTSLSENGITIPSLNVENIADTNRYSFVSLRNWVTAEGVVCGADTIFYEDTVLHLNLFEVEENNSVNYICCDEHEASFGFYTNFHSPEFKFGQSFPATAIHDLASAQACQIMNWNHPGMRIIGWELHNAATGEAVPFVAGLPITDVYRDEYSSAIKVYAVYGVTATFLLDTGVQPPVSCEVSLPAGAALGDSIPDPVCPEGHIFVGWKDRETGAFATSATLIHENATFVPQFADLSDACAVSFTYFDAEGIPQTQTTVYAMAGTTLSSAVDSQGIRLEAIPDPVYQPENHYFLGWYTSAAGETAVAAALDMVISQNTTFVANYATAGQVYLHDLYADGEEVACEALQDIAPNTPLAEILSDGSWPDGTPYADCVWYLQSNGVQTRLALTDPVPVGANLFTYTYRIVLHLSAPQQMLLRSVQIEGTDPLIITLREGETIKPTDLVHNGVDLTQYLWNTEDSQGVSLLSLLGAQISESITFTWTGLLVDSTLREHQNTDINFYVFVDGQRKLVAHRNDVTAFSRGTDHNGNWYRCYLTPALLESIYAEYDFSADMVQPGTYYFPYVDRDENWLWADIAVLARVDGTRTLYFQPIVQADPSTNQVPPFDLYYFPNQTYCAGAQNNGLYTNAIADNTFYSLTIERKDTPTEVSYHFQNDAVSITLPYDQASPWYIRSSGNVNAVTQTIEGNTVRFTIPHMDAPYVLSQHPPRDFTIQYSIALPTGIDPAFPEYETPLIQGVSSYTTAPSEPEEFPAQHTVLSPSHNIFFYKIYQNSVVVKHLGEATFLGWALNGDTTILYQPGDVLSIPQGGSYSLTAQWDTQPSGVAVRETSPIINYYVSLKALLDGAVQNNGEVQQEYFTESVHACDCGYDGLTIKAKHLYEKQVQLQGTEVQYHVLGDTNVANLNNAHAELVRQLSAGYTMVGNDDQEYTFHATFPTDEAVMRNARKRVTEGAEIRLNGYRLQPSDINTNNFTVKWYVFKWSSSDGWHIDGYLVAKKGTLRVTKQFVGEPDIVAQAKQGFYIDVQLSGDNVQNVALRKGGILTLNENTVYDEATKRTRYGYTSYDPATDTYTWEIETDPFFRYTISEENYLATEGYVTDASYRVRNSRTAAENTAWEAYGNQVTITGTNASEVDGVLTVDFRNLYTLPGTFLLEKRDAVTGAFLPGVSFTVAKVGEPDFALVQRQDGVYCQAQAGQTGGTTVTTDGNGLIRCALYDGTYTLTEQALPGYVRPEAITVVISNGEITTVTSSDGAATKRSAHAIEVRNESEKVDLRVEKVWIDGENKPVTFQLFCNDHSMGTEFTKTLNGQETPAWQHTFRDLPLYVDGAPAQYKLRETVIGDFRYSSEYHSGYQYYMVNLKPMQYLDEDGQLVDLQGNTTVETILLQVENTRARANITLTKQDLQYHSALLGAHFSLYRTMTQEGDTVQWDGAQLLVNDHPWTDHVEAVSDANGYVSFSGVPAGQYYLVEHTPPVGYQPNHTVYRVTVNSDETFSIEQTGNQGATWTPLPNKVIYNAPVSALLTVKKVDQQGHFLSGATFQLLRRNEQNLYENFGDAFTVLSPRGHVISEMPAGDYRLVEVSAPAGYYRHSTPVDFSLGSAGIVYTGDDPLITYTPTPSTFTVANVPGSSLPNTGGIGATLYTFGGLACMAGSLLCGWKWQRRRERRRTP